jgi:hypothetical protein
MKFPFSDTPTFRSWAGTLIDGNCLEVTEVLSIWSFREITDQREIPGIDTTGQVTHAVYYQAPGTSRILIAVFAMLEDRGEYRYIMGAGVNPSTGEWRGNHDLSAGEIASLIRQGHLYACEKVTAEAAAERRQPTAQEPNIQIQFQGYTLDLFMTDNGSLGLTIERSPAHEDNPSVDVFITQDLKVTHV